jgi:toxin-antitoxin system PIN domain toxin
VIALDTNILVYAHRRDALQHEVARDAVAHLAESGSPWAIPWPCLGEFYSVATGPRHYDPPSAPDEAIDQVDVWLEAPTLAVLGENATTWSVLRTLLAEAKTTGPRVHDARIAAICLAHGVRELWTADRDYGRFPALRVRNPLVRG